MKPVRFAALLMGFMTFGASTALACRIPPRPEALRDMEAEAIVLVRVSAVEVSGRSWSAIGVTQGILMGSGTGRELSFANRPFDSCGQMAPPRLERYWVLYLQRSDGALRVRQAYPYWWARRSGDRRLRRLDALLPLGAARDASADEARLLELVEPRVRLPAGATDLSRYTRVYARTSASGVRGTLLRSRTPRRLIVDSSEELPTEESCGCHIVHVTVDLDDLWSAGRLPSFDP